MPEKKKRPPPRKKKRSPSEKHKAGRKAVYSDRFPALLKIHAQNGATDIELADLLDIGVSTLYRWKNEYPAFREACKADKEAADERVERSLFHRAVGYTYASEKIVVAKGVPKRVPIREHVPPDPGAAMKWLSIRNPAWRNQVDHTHSLSLAEMIALSYEAPVLVEGDIVEATALPAVDKPEEPAR